MKIVFDLDGTLICAKKRLYELFSDLLDCRELSFNSYWEMKLAMKSNQDILKLYYGCSDEQVERFTVDWMSKIESDYYLEFDKLIDGLVPFLNKVSNRNTLYVCTARQSFEKVVRQLEQLGILGYFNEILVTEQKLTKKELLINSRIDLGKNDWMVGDTGHDIMTGRSVGINACAVLTGFMSRSTLMTYAPDLILSDVTKFDIS